MPSNCHEKNTKMSWLAVSVVVDGENADALSDEFLRQGALSVDIADATAGTTSEVPMFAEPGSVINTNWSVNRLVALFLPEANPENKISAIFKAAKVPENTPDGVDGVDDQDWVRLTQAQFTPQQISARLWVVPTWHALVDKQAINIRLDPGLAFGTGTHPTTRLCLRWLDQQRLEGRRVTDYGCGSGILAIAAMKLGAHSAMGVDIDEQALFAARNNALMNQTEVTFYPAEMATEVALQVPADIVLANILAHPLEVLAPLLAKITAVGGRIALSGILAQQADEVRERYSQWFDMQAIEREDEWVMLSGIKKAVGG